MDKHMKMFTYEYKIELTCHDDFKEFNEAVCAIPEKVKLMGFDENGEEWIISAKSFLSSLGVAANALKNRSREHTAHEVDYNTLVCGSESEKLYSAIQKFVVS